MRTIVQLVGRQRTEYAGKSGVFLLPSPNEEFPVAEFCPECWFCHSPSDYAKAALHPIVFVEPRVSGMVFAPYFGAPRKGGQYVETIVQQNSSHALLSVRVDAVYSGACSCASNSIAFSEPGHTAQRAAGRAGRKFRQRQVWFAESKPWNGESGPELLKLWNSADAVLKHRPKAIRQQWGFNRRKYWSRN